MRARLLLSREPGFPSPQQLADFVAEHARGGLLARGADVMADAIERGLLVAILVESGKAGIPAGIAAMAGILPLADGKFEVGGALVRPDMTGFGLQQDMMQARLAAYPAYRIAPWTKLYSCAARAEYGRGSRAAIERAGFEPIAHEASPVEFQDECRTCTKPIPEEAVCCYQMYLAGAGCSAQGYAAGTVEKTRRRDGARLRLSLPELAPV